MAKIEIKNNVGKAMAKVADGAKDIGHAAAEKAERGVKVAGQKAKEAQCEIQRSYITPYLPQSSMRKTLTARKL